MRLWEAALAVCEAEAAGQAQARQCCNRYPNPERGRPYCRCRVTSSPLAQREPTFDPANLRVESAATLLVEVLMHRRAEECAARWAGVAPQRAAAAEQAVSADIHKQAQADVAQAGSPRFMPHLRTLEQAPMLWQASVHRTASRGLRTIT